MVQPGVAAEKSVKVNLDSDLSAMRGIQDQVLQELAKYGFDSHSHFAVRLALEEGIINAMKHGNRFDPKRKSISNIASMAGNWM